MESDHCQSLPSDFGRSDKGVNINEKADQRNHNTDHRTDKVDQIIDYYNEKDHRNDLNHSYVSDVDRRNDSYGNDVIRRNDREIMNRNEDSSLADDSFNMTNSGIFDER